MPSILPETLPDEWARPHVGQAVELRFGGTVEVISVRKCNDLLRLMTEANAIVTGSRLAATYGKHWQSIYYEADGVGRRGLVTFTPNDVVKILDR